MLRPQSASRQIIRIQTTISWWSRRVTRRTSWRRASSHAIAAARPRPETKASVGRLRHSGVRLVGGAQRRAQVTRHAISAPPGSTCRLPRIRRPRVGFERLTIQVASQRRSLAWHGARSRAPSDMHSLTSPAAGHAACCRRPLCTRGHPPPRPSGSWSPRCRAARSCRTR